MPPRRRKAAPPPPIEVVLERCLEGGEAYYLVRRTGQQRTWIFMPFTREDEAVIQAFEREQAQRVADKQMQCTRGLKGGVDAQEEQAATAASAVDEKSSAAASSHASVAAAASAPVPAVASETPDASVDRDPPASAAAAAAVDSAAVDSAAPMDLSSDEANAFVDSLLAPSTADDDVSTSAADSPTLKPSSASASATVSPRPLPGQPPQPVSEPVREHQSNEVSTEQPQAEQPTHDNIHTSAAGSSAELEPLHPLDLPAAAAVPAAAAAAAAASAPPAAASADASHPGDDEEQGDLDDSADDMDASDANALAASTSAPTSSAAMSHSPEALDGDGNDDLPPLELAPALVLHSPPPATLIPQQQTQPEDAEVTTTHARGLKQEVTSTSDAPVAAAAASDAATGTAASPASTPSNVAAVAAASPKHTHDSAASASDPCVICALDAPPPWFPSSLPAQAAATVLSCHKCGVSVHAACYGVSVLPLAGSHWWCSPCDPSGLQRHEVPGGVGERENSRRVAERESAAAAGPAALAEWEELNQPQQKSCYDARDISCCLCRHKGGALLPVVYDFNYAHVLCARYMPPEKLKCWAPWQPFIYLDTLNTRDVRSSDADLIICPFCRMQRFSYCHACAAPDCKERFHVTCAQRKGCTITAERLDDETAKVAAAAGSLHGDVPYSFRALCRLHSGAKASDGGDASATDTEVDEKTPTKPKPQRRKRKVISDSDSEDEGAIEAPSSQQREARQKPESKKPKPAPKPKRQKQDEHKSAVKTVQPKSAKATRASGNKRKRGAVSSSDSSTSSESSGTSTDDDDNSSGTESDFSLHSSDSNLSSDRTHSSDTDEAEEEVRAPRVPPHIALQQKKKNKKKDKMERQRIIEEKRRHRKLKKDAYAARVAAAASTPATAAAAAAAPASTPAAAAAASAGGAAAPSSSSASGRPPSDLDAANNAESLATHMRMLLATRRQLTRHNFPGCQALGPRTSERERYAAFTAYLQAQLDDMTRENQVAEPAHKAFIEWMREADSNSNRESHLDERLEIAHQLFGYPPGVPQPAGAPASFTPLQLDSFLRYAQSQPSCRPSIVRKRRPGESKQDGVAATTKGSSGSGNKPEQPNCFDMLIRWVKEDPHFHSTSTAAPAAAAAAAEGDDPKQRATRTYSHLVLTVLWGLERNFPLWTCRTLGSKSVSHKKVTRQRLMPFSPLYNLSGSRCKRLASELYDRDEELGQIVERFCFHADTALAAAASRLMLHMKGPNTMRMPQDALTKADIAASTLTDAAVAQSTTTALTRSAQTPVPSHEDVQEAKRIQKQQRQPTTKEEEKRLRRAREKAAHRAKIEKRSKDKQARAVQGWEQAQQHGKLLAHAAAEAAAASGGPASAAASAASASLPARSTAHAASRAPGGGAASKHDVSAAAATTAASSKTAGPGTAAPAASNGTQPSRSSPRKSVLSRAFPQDFTTSKAVARPAAVAPSPAPAAPLPQPVGLGARPLVRNDIASMGHVKGPSFFAVDPCPPRGTMPPAPWNTLQRHMPPPPATIGTIPPPTTTTQQYVPPHTPYTFPVPAAAAARPPAPPAPSYSFALFDDMPDLERPK